MPRAAAARPTPTIGSVVHVHRRPTRGFTTTRTRAAGRRSGDDGKEEDADEVDVVDADETTPTRRRGPSVQGRGSSARLEAVAPKPCFRLGVFADAQYGDKADETRDDDPSRVKRFRASAQRLEECLAAFGREASSLSGIINLGDLFDGYNEDRKDLKPVLRGPMSDELKSRNAADLAVVADLVNAAGRKTPMYHTVGNHDCNVSEGKEEFLRAVNMVSPYYSVALPRGWRLIVLDTTDLNPRYIKADAVEYEPAMAFAVDAVEKNREEIVPWGGGLGPRQFAWFENELEECKEKNERVIVASHNALHPLAARFQMSAWNSGAVAELMERSGVVKICLAGHDHPGKYHKQGGVHYVTLEAMLEAREGETSYAFLDVYEHEAVLTGVGVATSRRMRVSPHGLFTGIATFESFGDIISSGSGARVETSSMGIVEWINRYGRD